MHAVAINPLLSDEHFDAGFGVSLKIIVEMLRFIREALAAQTAELIFDSNVEARYLKDGKNISTLIGSVSDADLKRQWYIYSRNRARPANGDVAEASTVTDGTKPVAYGLLHTELLQKDISWISFPGCASIEMDQLPVILADETKIKSNAFSMSSFLQWWPQYEASPKHGKFEYTRSGGERVSPMRLDPSRAQSALMQSKEINGKRTCKVAETYIVFMKTYPDKNIFHGFEITKEEYEITIDRA